MLYLKKIKKYLILKKIKGLKIYLGSRNRFAIFPEYNGRETN